jgi:hypothetical protein
MPAQENNSIPSPEAERTRVYRRMIIRQTLRIAKENPSLQEKELLDLVEREVIRLCELCVASAQTASPFPWIGKYFIGRADDLRKDHVARLFLHNFGKNLRAGNVMEYLIPVFATSVGSLFGQAAYEKFLQRIRRIKSACDRGNLTYNQMLEKTETQALAKEILALYKEEMERTTGFEDRLKNCLDDALVIYQNEQKTGHFNIAEAVNMAYGEFVRLLTAMAR